MPRRLSALVSALSLCVCVFAADPALPRSTPEEQGLRSADVREFLDAMVMQPDLAEAHGVVVVRHGHVVGEAYPMPFSPGYAHTLYSVSKTFTAAAVGLAVDRGLLSVDDQVASILADKLPAHVSPHLAALRVRDLLIMSSGIKPDWEMRNRHTNWMPVWLAKPNTGPGIGFAYDSMCSYLLSAIVQRVTGQTVLDYLNDHIFGPMGVTDAEWELSPEGVCTGGWGLHVRPEVMAKFGLMLLDKGRYDGQRLLSEEWVTSMMTPHIRANAAESYGYQMWQCSRFGAWRADGAYGQYIVVIPEKDMVVVLTQCSARGAAKSLAPVWKLAATAGNEALEPSDDAGALLRRQGEYEFKPAAGARTNAAGAMVHDRTFRLPVSDLGWRAVSFDLRSDKLVLRVTTDGGSSYNIECGQSRWLTSHTPVPPPYSIKARSRFRGIRHDFAVSGSYGWLPDGTLNIAVVYPNWISAVYLTFNPVANTMTVRLNYQTKPFTLKVTRAVR